MSCILLLLKQEPEKSLQEWWISPDSSTRSQVEMEIHHIQLELPHNIWIQSHFVKRSFILVLLIFMSIQIFMRYPNQYLMDMISEEGTYQMSSISSAKL